MRDAFIKSLCKAAEGDPRIFLIVGDLGFKVFDEYISRFPRQFLNAGIAEQNMTGLATGIALEGRVVFTYSIANFPTLRCLEQIRNDACYHRANVNVVAIGAGFSYGQLGFSHHATEDISILRSLPELTIMSPGDNWEASECVTALVNKDGAGYLRLDREGALNTRTNGERFSLGHARLVRDGKDVSLITTGGMLKVVLEAAQMLEGEGIWARVLQLHTIKPFDLPAIVRASKETAGIVTIEEHTVEGGLGGLVAENLMESGVYPGFFLRIGFRQGFSSLVGDQDYLRKSYGLDAAAIFRQVVEATRRKSDHAS